MTTFDVLMDVLWLSEWILIYVSDGLSDASDAGNHWVNCTRTIGSNGSRTDVLRWESVWTRRKPINSIQLNQSSTRPISSSIPSPVRLKSSSIGYHPDIVFHKERHPASTLRMSFRWWHRWISYWISYWMSYGCRVTYGCLGGCLGGARAVWLFPPGLGHSSGAPASIYHKHQYRYNGHRTCSS